LHSVAFLLVTPVLNVLRRVTYRRRRLPPPPSYTTAHTFVPRPLAVLPVRGYPVADTTQRDAGLSRLTSVQESAVSLKLLTVAMLAACVALTGCDDQSSDRAVQKLKEFFNAVKPDALLLKDMTPGVTTEAQIRDQMGKPETERTFTDGSKRFEYPRGPQGLNTYMVDIDRDGKLQAITQVLTAANFAKIRMGMSEDEVRRLLGKPGQVAVFPLKPETVWSWKWREGGVTEEGIFNVHFDQYQKVYTTSRSDVIRGR
jgi:outer membrane protein assembly factor BamE (lipoprotein component of BamABCDE complex)